MSTTDVLPPVEARAIAALDQARRSIELARDSGDIASLLEWRDRAAAIIHYQHRRDAARGIADDAGEVKVRAEAALGQLDLDANPSRGGGPGGGATPAVAPPEIAPNTRRDWRRLGRLDRQQLDDVVEQLRADDGGGVTTTRAVRVARDVAPPEPKEPKLRANPKAKPSYSDAQARRLREMFGNPLDHAVSAAETAVERFDGAMETDPMRAELEAWLAKATQARAELTSVCNRLKRRL